MVGVVGFKDAPTPHYLALKFFPVTIWVILDLTYIVFEGLNKKVKKSALAAA